MKGENMIMHKLIYWFFKVGTLGLYNPNAGRPKQIYFGVSLLMSLLTYACIITAVLLLIRHFRNQNDSFSKGKTRQLCRELVKLANEKNIGIIEALCAPNSQVKLLMDQFNSEELDRAVIEILDNVYSEDSDLALELITQQQTLINNQNMMNNIR